MKKQKNEQNISLNLETINDIFSPYSDENNYMIKNEIVTHIENCVEDAKRDSDVNIYIKTPKLPSQKEQDECKKAFKKYYKIKAEDDKKHLGKMIILAFLVLLVGVVCLFFCYFGILWNAHYIIQLLLEIVAWVFVWEAVHILVFQCTLERIKLRYNNLLLKAKLHFTNKEK